MVLSKEHAPHTSPSQRVLIMCNVNSFYINFLKKQSFFSSGHFRHILEAALIPRAKVENPLSLRTFHRLSDVKRRKCTINYYLAYFSTRAIAFS